VFRGVRLACQKAVCFRAGFDAVFHTSLKASPERRPEKAGVEAEGRIVHETRRVS